MIMGTNCFSCLINQVEKTLSRLNIDQEQSIIIIKKIMRLIADNYCSQSAPVMGRMVHTKINELLGIDDPSYEIKKMSNDNALSLLPFIKKIISKSGNPMIEALKVSISGNIIDYGAPGSGDTINIKKSVNDALKMKIPEHDLKQFFNDIENKEKILFIGDNTGEIVFDMEFIKLLPGNKIVYCVRGNPILNDSTYSDAEYIGMDRILNVIDTGDNTPGIDFGRSSEQFINEVKESDMIILKGQGNFETLYEEDIREYAKKNTPLYFLLKVKCGFVADLLNKEIGDIAFIRKTIP